MRWSMAAAVFLSFSGATLAHGGMDHVMGTVKSVSATSLTVTTKGGKDVEVQLDAETRFEGASSAAGLKPGQRVVVHAKKAGEGLHAETVKSRAGKAKMPAP
jgi:hypothetical protein